MTTYSVGKYQAVVVEQGFQEASTGTPGFYLQLEIVARVDDQGRSEDCPRYRRSYRQWLANETGLAILKSDLHTLGVQFDELSQLDPSNESHVSLVGRTIEVVCDHQAYNGRTTEQWRIARDRKKLSVDGIRSLDTRFAHLLGNGVQKKNLPSA